MVDVKGSGFVGGVNQSAENDFGNFAFFFEWIELPDGIGVNSLVEAGFEVDGAGNLTGDLGPGQTVYNAGGTDDINVPAQNGTLGDNGDLFAVRVSTTLNVTNGGNYTFELGSDDGSRLFVDGVEIIDNDGPHPFEVVDGTVNLTPGLHEIEIIYFERAGQSNLGTQISGPDYTGTIALQDADVQANAGNDTIVASDGDDIIEGGDGDDSLDGGVGNDTIDGGPGNDTVRGDGDVDGGTLTRESFNWSLLPDPDDGGVIDNQDDLGDGGTQTTGSIDVTFEFTPEARADGIEFLDDETQLVTGIDSGAETINENSAGRLSGITGGTPGDTGTLTFSFSSNAADTLEEVRNVEFRINDIDQLSWRDVVQVRAFDANGTPVVVNLGLGAPGDITLSDEDGVPGTDTATADEDAGNGVSATPENSLLVSIPGPVSRIEIDYGNLSTGGQVIDVTDVFFDSVQVDGDFDDSISGGDGDDALFGELGDDNISGDAGEDTIDGSVGDDTLSGGAGNDEVTGGTGDDSIDGGADADTLFGNEGADTIAGGSGNDSAAGGTGNDSLQGDAGNDTLGGGAGDDTLSGGANDDSLDGGQGNDEIEGGTGSDTIVASTGTDTITGGEGIDTYSVPGTSTFDDDETTITVTVDENGDGTVQKSIGSTTDQIGSVERFVADEASAEFDRLVYTTTVTDEGTITGLNDATGLFVNTKTGSVTFFGNAGQPTFNEVLDLDVTGLFFANGSDLDGTVGNIAFEDFESLEFSVVCFTRDTLIDTPDGRRAVQDLVAGDLVTTMDNGPQPVRWVGCRRFSREMLDTTPHLRPVTIRAGALGNDRDLNVSPQHRMLVTGMRNELMFGTSEVLVKAKDLLQNDDVVVADAGDVEYFHILFDDHEIVYANGAPAESLHPGREAMDTLADDSRKEVLSIFPELGDHIAEERKLARYALRSYEARALDG